MFIALQLQRVVIYYDFNFLRLEIHRVQLIVLTEGIVILLNLRTLG